MRIVDARSAPMTETIRLTTAQAVVKFLGQQWSDA